MESKSYDFHVCDHMINMLRDKKLEIGYYLGDPTFTFKGSSVLDNYHFKYCPICGKPIIIEGKDA